VKAAIIRVTESRHRDLHSLFAWPGYRAAQSESSAPCRYSISRTFGRRWRSSGLPRYACREKPARSAESPSSRATATRWIPAPRAPGAADQPRSLNDQSPPAAGRCRRRHSNNRRRDSSEQNPRSKNRRRSPSRNMDSRNTRRKANRGSSGHDRNRSPGGITITTAHYEMHTAALNPGETSSARRTTHGMTATGKSSMSAEASRGSATASLSPRR
jgi:hypothetical protein